MPDDLVPGARAPDALQRAQALDGPGEVTVHQGPLRHHPGHRRRRKPRRRRQDDRGAAEAGDRVEQQRRRGQDRRQEVQGEGGQGYVHPRRVDR